MAKLAIKKATTDVTVYLFIQASNVTTGAGLTGLTFETANLVASYVRPLGARAALTLATQTVDGAHSDGGFKEIDATNMPGVYRLDLPDAVCATGVPSVVVMLKGAANMAPVLLEIQLTDFDLNTAAITAAGVADAVWDEATADHTTASSFGSLDANVDAILADTGTDGVVLKAAGLAADAVTAIQSGLATPTNITAGTIATVTNLTNLPAAPTDWLTGAAVKADAVTKLQANLALEATLTAIKGAGWDTQTLAAIDVLIDAIKLKTDTIPATPAQAGEYTAAIAAIPTAPLLAANYTAPDNAGIAAIQAKTDDLTFTTPNKVDASATVDTSGVAGAVWDELLASHTDVGSAGAALAASGSAGDPWSTALPGAYGAGTAGLALSDILAKTDALDVSDVSFVTSVSGSTITVVRGDTLDDPHLLNIGDLTDYVSIDIMVKRGTGEADDAAIIHIRKNASGLADGLLKLNGAAPALATDGWITIDDVPTGDITPNLKATVTDDLTPGSYVYDVQVIKATNVKTRTTGTWIVTADVTRLVA